MAEKKKSEKPKKPDKALGPWLYITPLASTALVRCDGKDKHPLSHLFLVFKLVPGDGSSKPEKIARVFDDGTKPPDPGPEPSGKKDKKAWNDAVDEYAQWSKDNPPDPADQYVVGFVDDAGYLQPVHADSDPWFEVGVLKKDDGKAYYDIRRDPHSYKLAVGEKYSICALRHPSADMARALAEYLNSGGVKDRPEYGFAKWEKDPKALVRTKTISGDKVGSGVQAVIELSESVDDYYPKGGERYGHWTLYRDMPHNECPSCADAVVKLGGDLSRLRYPIGSEEWPYSWKPKASKKTKKKADADEDEDKPHPVLFDGKVQAAVARFQEHVLEGHAFEVNDRAHCHDASDDDLSQGGKTAWAYLIGADRSGLAKPDATISVTERGTGIVGTSTASEIEKWLKAGYRKPGQVLVPTFLPGGEPWMLNHGAVCIDAWHVLLQVAFGSYGLRAGSTLRSVLTGAGAGQVMGSIHKSGLAIDFSGGATRFATPDWPIRFEAFFVHRGEKLVSAQSAYDAARRKLARRMHLQESTDPRAAKLLATWPSDGDLAADLGKKNAALDAAKKSEGATAGDEAGKIWKHSFGKPRWRVYAQSQLDAFAHLDTAMAALADGLRTYVGRGEGSLFGKIKACFPKALADSDDVAKWIDDAIAVQTKAARGMLDRVGAKDGEDAQAVYERRLEFVEDYFRSAVIQWHVNFYEADGGTNGRRYLPDEGDEPDFPRKEKGASWTGSKSWINVTAIGHACGVERIGPHEDARDNSWYVARGGKAKASKFVSMRGYFARNSKHEVVGHGEVTDVVEDITEGKTTAHVADGQQEQDFGVEVQRGEGKHARTILTYKPADIDGHFFRAWADAATKFESRPRDLVSHPGGAQVALVWSATDDGKKVLDRVTSALEGDFKDKSFVVVSAGEKTKLDLAPYVLKTGADLAAAIKKSRKAFEEATTAYAKAHPEPAKDAGDQGTTGKDAKAKRRAQHHARNKAAREVAPQEKRDRADWCVVLQPIFAHPVPASPTPPAKPGDPPAPLDPQRITLLPEDSLLLPPSPEAAVLEWWHYQDMAVRDTKVVNPQGDWGGLVEQCGYSRRVMMVPMDGEKKGGPIHRGLNYPEKLLSGAGAWSAEDEGAPENRDMYTPAEL